MEYNIKNFSNPSKRLCKECGEEFYGKGNSRYCSRLCASRNEYTANMLDYRWRIGKLFSAAKFRANDKKLDFDLTKEYLYTLWEETEGICPISNRKFDLSSFGKKGQVNPNAPSIDRIIPELGYIQGNVRFVTYHVNVALSEFGLEAFQKLARDVAFRGI